MALRPPGRILSSGPLSLLVAALALVVLHGAAGAASARALATGEQDMLALLPYRLTGTAVPAGFRAFQQTAVPNVSLAFSYPPEQRQDALAYLDGSGRITGLQQQFQLATGNPPLIRLTVGLYDSAEDAAAAALITGLPSGSINAAPLPLPALGDGSHALLGTLADGTTEDAGIAWSRGRVYLGIDAQGAAEDASAAAQLFAGAADRMAAAQHAALPAAPLDQATGETATLALAAQFEARQLPAAAAPAGFALGGSYLWSNEQIVIDSPSPAAVEGQLAGDWRRTTAEVEYFQAGDGTRSVVSSVYAGFADAAGASSALQAKALGTAGGSAAVPLSLSLQLGDESAIYQSVLIWPGQEVRLSYTVLWRHGNVLLGISVNVPSGTPAPDYLAAAAQALDDAYAANPI